MKFKFQGDIPFAPFEGEVAQNYEHNGSVVLALGEHTGHKHVISVPNVEDMVIHKLQTGGWLIDLRAEGTVKHEQHGQITIAPGKYRVYQEREVDHFQDSLVRQVID